MRRLVLTISVAFGLFVMGAPSPAVAAYAGEDGRVAFVRGDQVYTVAKTGGEVTQLTYSGRNTNPKWSPDGKWIAYLHEAADGVRDVWVMSARGHRKKAVTTSGDVTAAPSWSPDGLRLAFAAGPQEAFATLYTISSRPPFGAPVPMLGYYTGCVGCDPSDAANPYPIQVDRYLAWSPDGSQIALFNHVDAQVDYVIYWYDVATGEAKAFRSGGGACCGDADWSDLAWGPNGDFGYAEVLYFEAGTAYDPPLVRIIYPGWPIVQGDRYPAPSPSGAYMAFVNDAGGTSQVFTASITGADRTLLVDDAAQPDWQPGCHARCRC